MDGSSHTRVRHGSRRRRLSRIALATVVAYLALAYFLVPLLWKEEERFRVRSPDDLLTHTPDNIPGDPINVGLVGERVEILAALNAAGWRPADAITFKSSLEIGLSVILDRPYPDAPVSTLLFDGRRQDFAFERPDGQSADRRHHVRFWQQDPDTTGDGRPSWFGAASFDIGVGVSHDTGQVTHHIAPDVDAERDLLIAQLMQACALDGTRSAPGSGPTQDRRNGGGDVYFTDGLMRVGLVVPGFPGQRNCQGGNE